MGDTTNPPSRTDSPASRSATPKKQVRILMLHGYTQSGPLFRAKTRALEKLLAKALAPIGLVPSLLYPTGPNRLSVKDIPGYEPRDGCGGASAEDEDNMIDSWAWFRRDEATGRYRFLEEGMRRLAEVVSEARVKVGGEGFVDGVVGFSQGGCMAGMLASAMEEGREVVVPEEHQGWLRAVREANGGRALKFAVIYSGFYAVPQDLAWLYAPKIKTPTLHFLGSLDTVVCESRSQGLLERCEDPMVLTHPGGHHVPVSKEWVMPLAGFVKKCLEEEGEGTKL
ncbi:serine hydrolase FSH [Chaetomidium leptoderma]|uniref:Serine hydrolase FSH n=1 Tax=Chaetomidium leptoderma TaxID=669021 RepID=A0AAN7A0Z1_9PEZI|nr:serine hydrolase FSH [Chaetomidium leptoderma]